MHVSAVNDGAQSFEAVLEVVTSTTLQHVVVGTFTAGSHRHVVVATVGTIVVRAGA